MRGVILAGGLGTRLNFYTNRVTNKHLAYVYNRAMIDYPLLSLVSAGIKDVVIVTGGRYGGEITNYFGNGAEFGLKTLNYGYQYGEGGIAAALRCARPFCKNEPVCVMLGDNLFEDDLYAWVKSYKTGGKILLKKVTDPRSFGVATLDDEGKIVNIIEKPKVPESDLAIVGAYIFDKDVFDVIETLKPSDRGELEVTDLIRHYHIKNKLKYQELQGFWSDMGSAESLLESSIFISNNYKPFEERFQKYFNINLSLPFSRSAAVKLKQLIKNGDTHSAMSQIQKHIDMIDKWKLL